MDSETNSLRSITPPPRQVEGERIGGYVGAKAPFERRRRLECVPLLV